MTKTSATRGDIPLDPYSTVRLVPVAQLGRVFRDIQTLAILCMLGIALQMATLTLLISLANRVG